MGSFLSVIVEQAAIRSANNRPARSTPWDQVRPKARHERRAGCSHEELSVGQVTPTRDLVFLVIFIRTNIHLGYFDQTRKQQRSPGDYASTDETAPGRVGKYRQGEARRANTTPNGAPHLEVGHLRLKTWSKSDFPIAETTSPTYLYIKCIRIWQPLTLSLSPTR